MGTAQGMSGTSQLSCGGHGSLQEVSGGALSSFGAFFGRP